MMKEIGGEFWTSPEKTCDKRFFLSGRTSLEYIARDIKRNSFSDSVLLPSYCCHTMIEPFVRHDFSIRFYDVFYSKERKCICAELPPYREKEVLFYMSYFGFSQISGLDLKTLREKYRIIIDDRTHSWLRTQSLGAQADYSFTSFRKWGAFSGISEACKYIGCFSDKVWEKRNDRYISMRDTAFGQKADYIVHGGEKELFLKLFGEAEMLLEEDYEGYRPSYRVIDMLFSTAWEAVRSRRRENAKILLDGLTGVKEIVLPFAQIDEGDSPLFVPILVENGRDALRRYLIEHQVYCPVHWPKSNLHEQISERASGLYSTELSLVCDQRYGQEEMKRIVSLIVNYYRRGR